MSHASTVPRRRRPLPLGTRRRALGLVMPAVLAAFSLYLLLGSLTMDTDGADFPGPDFFPLILSVAGLVIAAALAVEVVRVRQAPEGQADADGEVGQAAGPLTLFHSDFGALAWCFLGFLAFAVLLPWLGWILAGALLFWCITRAFGAPHPCSTSSSPCSSPRWPTSASRWPWA